MKTADLSDAYPEVQICEPIFLIFGGHISFSGRIRTVKCFEDNTFVRKTLSEPSAGEVLVVDAGGSRRCAMLGDILAQLGVDNGWSGIVINGLIRDSHDISQMPIGVRALGTIPLRSVKDNTGKADIPVKFSGVTFTPGHYIYADHDGIIVSTGPLTLPD